MAMASPKRQLQWQVTFFSQTINHACQCEIIYSYDSNKMMM